MRTLTPGAFFWNFVQLGFCLLLALLFCTTAANAGFLYVYNDTGNSIYGYSVNERTGALTPLTGFPVIANGTGGNELFTAELMNIDSVNRRLYVISDGSDMVNAYSINTVTGALTALPFSPIQLPTAGLYNSVKVNPSGALLAVNDRANSITHTYAITPTSATLSQTFPFINDTVINTVFSLDGNYFYQTGNSLFSGFNVNPTTGFMTQMTGSPFSPGTGRFPLTDSQGRIFGIINFMPSVGRVFTTNQGVPTLVSESTIGPGPFFDAALHPNENFIAATEQNRVFAIRINGTGAGTTLMTVADSVSEGVFTYTLAFNQAGNFLFAVNISTRNISTFNFSRDTGGITLNNVQPQGANGSGALPGIAYLPTGIAVFLSGRVMDSNGRAISGAVITATSAQHGTVHTARTNPFGYYIFDELIMGRSYDIEIRQKQFAFASQTITPSQEFSELNFTALP